jgi:nicotinic acetylcholine receptor
MKALIILVLTIFLFSLSKTQEYDYDYSSSNPQNSINLVEDNDILSDRLKASGYNNQVRPSLKVSVNFKLSLRQILSVDVQNQIITSNIYISAFWMDTRLIWNASSYSNTSNILVPANTLWLPDFCVMNSANGNGFIQVASNNLAVVSSTGLVYVILSVAGLQTRCKMNVMHYPFDSQNCSIILGSWQYDTTRIDFFSDDNKIDLTSYVSHPVWSLQRVQVYSVYSKNRFLKTTNFQNEDICFYIIIKRGPLYSMINNVYPCLILNVVTLSSYFLPFAIQVGLSMLN